MQKETDPLHQLAAHLPLMLRVKDVMREANCSKATVQRAINAKKLASVKRGKSRMVPKHAFLEWISTDQVADAA